MYSLDWMGKSQSVGPKTIPGTLTVFASDSLSKQGKEQEAKSSVWGSSLKKDYMRSPCQQMAARLIIYNTWVLVGPWGIHLSIEKVHIP